MSEEVGRIYAEEKAWGVSHARGAWAGLVISVTFWGVVAVVVYAFFH